MLLPAGGVFDILAVTTQENSVLRDNFVARRYWLDFLRDFWTGLAKYMHMSELELSGPIDISQN